VTSYFLAILSSSSSLASGRESIGSLRESLIRPIVEFSRYSTRFLQSQGFDTYKGNSHHIFILLIFTLFLLA
jgi:hypothetical protein